jgi:hypothetical protein
MNKLYSFRNIPIVIGINDKHTKAKCCILIKMSTINKILWFFTRPYYNYLLKKEIQEIILDNIKAVLKEQLFNQ